MRIRFVAMIFFYISNIITLLRKWSDITYPVTPWISSTSRVAYALRLRASFLFGGDSFFGSGVITLCSVEPLMIGMVWKSCVVWKPKTWRACVIPCLRLVGISGGDRISRRTKELAIAKPNIQRDNCDGKCHAKQRGTDGWHRHFQWKLINYGLARRWIKNVYLCREVGGWCVCLVRSFWQVGFRRASLPNSMGIYVVILGGSVS